MRILSIDPGPIESAYVVFECDGCIVGDRGKVPNGSLLRTCEQGNNCEVLVIEKIACMGMAVGEEVFETVFWSGRFAQAWNHGGDGGGRRWLRLPRADVKMHLCGSMRANDSNIRQALIYRYGGRDKAIGKKKTPGPLYGVAGDVWAALAVAATYSDKHTPAVAFAEAGKGGGV